MYAEPNRLIHHMFMQEGLIRAREEALYPGSYGANASPGTQCQAILSLHMQIDTGISARAF